MLEVMPPPPQSPEYVFIAHGFLGSPAEFLPMKWRLEGLGYRVCLWGHATVFKDLNEYSHGFHQFVLRYVSRNRIGKVHLLGHSMGAVIVRSAATELIARIPHWQRGKMVLLAPPNRGSYVARLIPHWVRRMVPAINDLSDQPDSFVNRLPKKPPLTTGIVWTKYDHMVHPASVPLPGIADSVEVGGLHTTMVFRKATAHMADRFFQNGKFH
jgi:pimeloyl-ACP methyl ester carboxylesterase